MPSEAEACPMCKLERQPPPPIKGIDATAPAMWALGFVMCVKNNLGDPMITCLRHARALMKLIHDLDACAGCRDRKEDLTRGVAPKVRKECLH